MARRTIVARPPSQEDEPTQQHLTRNHQAVKELQDEVDDLQTRLTALEALVAGHHP